MHEDGSHPPRASSTSGSGLQALFIVQEDDTPGAHIVKLCATDSKFGSCFVRVVSTSAIEILQAPYHAPRANAILRLPLWSSEMNTFPFSLDRVRAREK